MYKNHRQASSKCYLGVAGMPLFLALSLSPILSIHVPQLKRFPPLTKPVAGSTLTNTLKPETGGSRRVIGGLFCSYPLWQTQTDWVWPSSFMCMSIFGPAFLSLKEIPCRWRCRASWITSYKGCSCVHRDMQTHRCRSVIPNILLLLQTGNIVEGSIHL